MSQMKQVKKITSPKITSTGKNEDGVKVPPAPFIGGQITPGQNVAPPPPPINESRLRAKSAPKKRGDWLWVAIAGIMIVGFVLISGTTVLLIQANAETPIVTNIDDKEIEINVPLPTITPQVAHTAYDPTLVTLGNQLALPEGGAIELKPWDGQSRFTMVLVGLDRRTGQTGLSYRTDSMMVISIDPATNSLGILSIPRDMWVAVPGYASRHRINSPMVLGEIARKGSGPQLMMQTVQHNLGIPVHDYLAVDFQAVIGIVDAIGGIVVENERAINDYSYPDLSYGYDPFHLPAGTHQLNGYDALRYARTRHGDNDIYRAGRQQQVIMAVRDRILSAEMVPQLILQAPALWQNFSQNVNTGLSLEQIIQLGIYLKDIPMENITMRVIDYNYLNGYQTAGGASVLIPIQSRIGDLMVETFGSNYAT